MNAPYVLGLPLEEALLRLEAAGIHPDVEQSRAPRRPDGMGALRVVRTQSGGRRLTVCAFVTDVKDADDDG